jgi:hypothetical protein
MDWIHLAQDSNQCWVLVNMIMNIRFPKMLGIPLTDEQALAFHEGHSLMEVAI